MIEPLDDRDGLVLKTGGSQTFKLRAFLTSGTGSVIIDCIFLLPVVNPGGGANWGPAAGQFRPGYSIAFDGWDGVGGNGQFPTSDASGEVVDSSGNTSAPSPGSDYVDWNGGVDTTSSQRALVTARVTDSTKGAGSITAINYTGSWSAGSTYTVPADENVYLIDMNLDPWVPSFANDHGFQPWAADAAQTVYMDMLYTALVDPAGPRMHLRFRSVT